MDISRDQMTKSHTKWNLKAETEFLLKAAQNNAIPTN